MRVGVVSRMLAAVIGIVAFFLIPGLIMAALDGHRSVALAFLATMLGSWVFAAVVLSVSRGHAGELGVRGGFLVVSLSWAGSALVGAFPFFLSGAIPSFADAYFESMSGFTTTGASILQDIEALSPALLLWRSTTHWLGGMGIIVLSVAVLPLLGIQGGQLVKAEAPWPTVDKITPKITSTAKILWLVYIGLTIAQIVLLLFGGLDLFDAVTHTFGTMATGGFSPKNTSVAHYDSAYVDAVITVFMVLAGTNFLLHYAVITRRFDKLSSDTEFKAYITIFVGSVLLLTLFLMLDGSYGAGSGLRFASFQAASILTTTGFVTADYDLWPQAARVVLLCLMFVGGSAGSTGGGIKVARIVTMFKQAMNEFRHLSHPRGVFPISYNRAPMARRMVIAITSFVFLYLVIILLSTLVISLEDVSILTALSAALATLGNIGPGFEAVGPTANYAFFSEPMKWFLSFLMMAGRLELYTVLVLFSPAFWRY